MLSLLMFQSDYIARVMELGEADARARSGDIEAFLHREAEPRQRPTARDKLAHYVGAIRRRFASS